MCPRCSPITPQLCCDLCNPAEFEDKFVVSLEKRKPQPRRSTMKPYEPSEDDKRLRKHLDEWRWEMSVKLHGELFTNDFGCFTFMPNDVLDRICDAAHHNLITSIDALLKETRWHLTREHGQSVVDIVSRMRPETVSRLSQQTTTPVAATSGPKPRDLVCTSCGQPGHSSTYL